MKAKVLIIMFLFLGIYPTLLLSQNKKQEFQTFKQYEQNKQEQQASKKRTLLKEQDLTLEDIAVLEEPINPDEYVVGPGDVLIVTIGNDPNSSFPVQVTPEGKLLVPSVQAIDLRYLTLKEAEKKIAKAVSTKYKSSAVSVSLYSLRKFRVTVAGRVENPGTVIVTAADRVSTAIDLANIPIILESEEPIEIETVTGKVAPIQVVVKKEPSKRHIILKRQNGEKLNIDLQGYEITGDKSKNPYLLEGDVIYVPVYTKNLPTVEILGAVHEEGIYELMQGDRVMDIVKIAHGFTYNADSSHVEIAQFNSDHKTTKSFIVDLSKNEAQNEENNVLLQTDDRIYVRFIGGYNRKHTAEIKGEVKFPGFYTIEMGKTRLVDIVRAAGGFTENASLCEAFVIRRMYENDIDLEYERLDELTPAIMTDIEKEYYKLKTRERKGVIAVDFVKLFVKGDSSQNLLLRDDDYIEIPIKANIVKVVGQVKRPGVVPYIEGEKIAYYLKKTGGYGWNVNKRGVRLIRSDTGEWLRPNYKTEIRVGDTIFIPEKTEVDYWTFFREALQLTVQLVSLVIVLDNALNK